MPAKTIYCSAPTDSLSSVFADAIPNGGLFHTTCFLRGVDSVTCRIRIAEGETTSAMRIDPERLEAAKSLIGTTVVATILCNASGEWRALIVRSPEDFDHWYATRGEGQTVERMYEDHRAMFDKLRDSSST